mmetsp:Transcript_19196/g.31526  ORF Transcript_19196/g.31526 Transcript_19196/m.31526 type:complete len:295 (+) Transcript_19196:43-927(+)
MSCIWPHRTYGVVILFLLACFLHYFFWHIDVASTPIITTKSKQEVLPTYVFSSQYARQEIPHLTPVNPSTLIPSGSHPIDEAHRNGYLHTGHCLFIMDASGLLLFLKRSSDVVTCPSTWSILGEHSMAKEEARDTVVRGMEEELGLKQFGRLETSDSSSFFADFQTMNKKDTIHVAIQNITQYPLYYIRHYGPRLDNRIDSQLTYLWLARLPKPFDEIQITLDDEVADHKWISLEEFSDWIEDDARNYDKEEEKSKTLQIHEGQKDDGPPSGDFCHHTIRSLYAKGLDNLKLLL